MGLWDRIKDVGGRAGRGVGRFVEREVGGAFDPIVSAIGGDWRGALSGIGRGVKRAGQAGALFGKDKLAGVDVDVLGAAGGAVEGGLGPSEFAQSVAFGNPDAPRGGGWAAGAAGGALKGYGGVKGAQTLHNIGERLGINKQLGKIPNPFTDGPNYGPTRDEVNQQLMIRPDYEGFTPEDMADAEYRRGQQLLNSGPMRFDDYSTTTERLPPEAGGGAATFDPTLGGARSTITGTGRSSRALTPMQAEGQRILQAAADADPRSIRTRTAGTPMVPEGKIRHRFAAMGGPGGERYPEQQAAIEQAQWRATVPDQPDPIRTPGFYSPDTPESQRGPPLSFPTPQIPEDVIDPRSYMTAPAAVGPPVSAQENMNARGAVPAARFGAPGASGAPPEIVGGPVYFNPSTGGYSPMSGASNVGNMVNQAAGSVTPTETTTDGDPNKPWWRKGLDYVGEHPDVVVNAAGQLMDSRGVDDYYRRAGDVAERRITLQEQQQAYAQDKERLREAMLMRGPTSRWA